MDLTRFAIEKNRVFATIFVIVLIAGGASYVGMPRSEDPGFIIRTALVQTVFPGASPERVEMLVTDKLEKIIQEMPELDFVSSQTKAGVSLVFVNIREEYANMRPIWDNLRRKVERAAGDLPDSIIGPTVNDEFGDVFGSLIAITGDRNDAMCARFPDIEKEKCEAFDYSKLKEYAEQVRDELLLIDDAAKVEIVGAQEERVFVVFENARLAELGMSPVQLQAALQERNIVLPGGDLVSAEKYERIVVEPTGNFESLDDLKRSIVSLPRSNAMVHLEDILSIERGYVDPPEVTVRFNGEPALMLAVSLREGGNILRLGEGIEDVMRRAQRVYPVGVDFELLNFQPRDVARKINDFVRNLLQAVVFVAAIMLAFLGLRTGVIVASLIPSAILASFLIMSLLDIGLDQMSLAALIIALGMLVDNAIVMSESIMVQTGRGKPVVDAACDSARELRIPLLVSSLTTAAAFLPIFLSESNTGEYTAPLFKVVTITLLCSWVIALTLIPLLCVLFLKVEPRDGEDGRASRSLYRWYDAGLLFALRNRTITLVGVLVAFVLAMQGLAWVPKIFYPPNDRASFTVELDLPVGSPIERTDEVTVAVERFIEAEIRRPDDETSELPNWGTFVGQGPPRFVLPLDQKQRSPNYAYLLVNLDPTAQPERELFASIEKFVAANFPDANVTVRPMPLGPPAWPPVQIRISGRDVDEVFAIVEDVKARLGEVPGARQITDNWGPRSKKVIIEIDETRARLAGVTNRDVALSMQTYLTGLATTEYREDDELIPVVMRSRKDQRTDLNRILTMNIFAQATGQSVPLGQVAYPRLEWQPGVIERRNRLRTVSVEALLEPGYTVPDVLDSMEPWLEAQSSSWPFGYKWEFGGEAETSGKANAAIAEKLPIAVLVIVLLLTAQFNSLRKPLIILLTIPLALIGVTIGLLTMRSYFGFMTLLGIISLSGIVINNAIVLLDRIRIEIDENGLAPDAAVLTAARQRARPILLTTATTVAGLLPLWFGGGPMWEPMAIAIIFGLIFATGLTLVVVPVLYSLLFRVNFS